MKFRCVNNSISRCEMCKREEAVKTTKLDCGEEWKVCKGCYNAIQDQKWEAWMEGWLSYDNCEEE